jgi:RNA recognition motif-containing protein
MSQQKIYVGNLSYDSKESDLESFFTKYGPLTEVKLIKDINTGRSKGFAFLTFENQKDAEASLEANDAELQGRKIRVNIAKDTGGQRRGGGGGRRNGGGQSRFGGGNNHWSNRDRDRY